jgi:hypothetical protein
MNSDSVGGDSDVDVRAACVWQSEERKPSDSKVREVIDKIARCRYVWVDGESLEFSPDCVLFVLLYNNAQGVRERVIEGKESLRRVIVCDKESFKENCDRYG